MFNSEAIKKLAHSTKTAEAVFLALAERERPRRMLNITLLRQQLKANKIDIDEKDFYIVFKSLEAMEVGSIVYGRRGNPNIFTWYFSLKDIAAIGLGADVVIKAPPRERNKPSQIVEEIMKVEPGKQAVRAENQNGYLTLSIPLSLLKINT